MTDFELRERVRSATYHHLARLFEPPAEPALHEPILERLRELLAAVHPTAAEHAAALSAAWRDEGPERVRTDHMRLFVGPSGQLAPPYGSVYLDPGRELMGASTHAVVRLYASAGLRKAEARKDAPDHVAIELDAMDVVIARTVDACTEGDWARAEHLVEVQIALLQHHLSRWATPFAKLIRTGAETEYHLRVADLIEAFAKQEYLEDAPAMLAEFRELLPVAPVGAPA